MDTSVSKDRRALGFTLIEIVVALTIVGLLLSLAFPAMRELLSEDDSQTPVRQLSALVQELRSRAIGERRPYQIVFDFTSIYGLRYYYPYQEVTTFAEFLALQDEERVRRLEEIKRMAVERAQVGVSAIEGQPPPPPLPNIDDEYFKRTITLPEGVILEILSWGALQWTPMDGKHVHRWVFQASGVCEPLRLRLSTEDERWHELHFDVLTGEIVTQRYYAQ